MCVPNLDRVIRNNDTMRRAAAKELRLLERIAAADPDNKRYCIRLLAHFEHRAHLCMVFEALALNLREVLKKFGGGGGINLAGVRRFSRQPVEARRFVPRNTPADVTTTGESAALLHAATHSYKYTRPG